MSIKRGLLVIGTQRSGSNLLRLMLNQLPDVVALHPPHILQTFMPLLKQYGPLESSSNFSALVEDVCAFVENNPASWDQIPLVRQAIAARCEHRSLIQVYRAIHETAAEKHGKNIWCCKSMANVAYIPEIEADGLRPIYLHLFRDGRDVGLSFMKALVGEKHIYHLAKQWDEDQNLALKYCAEYAADRTIRVRYEELIAEPERVIKEICARLGTEYTADVLQYHESDEARTIADAGEMWKNVTKPVLSDNKNKFLAAMSEDDLVLFEAVAGNTLERLGYPLMRKEIAEALAVTPQMIAQYDAENARRKAEFKKQVSAKDLEKRRGQEEVVAKIKARLSSQAQHAAA